MPARSTWAGKTTPPHPRCMSSWSPRPPTSPLFPYTTPFRSCSAHAQPDQRHRCCRRHHPQRRSDRQRRRGRRDHRVQPGRHQRLDQQLHGGRRRQHRLCPPDRRGLGKPRRLTPVACQAGHPAPPPPPSSPTRRPSDLAAPTLSLTSDTGAADGITRNGAVTVSGAEADATIEYSLDGTSGWTSSFTAVEGDNTVYARQIDVGWENHAASPPLHVKLVTPPPHLPPLPLHDALPILQRPRSA